MKRYLALSAIGEDHPGIVAALTKVFYETGCNLENSSMTQLRGDFAVLLLVSAPESLSLQTINDLLQPLIEKWNLAVTLRQLKPEEMQNSVISPVLSYTLLVHGLDHPGIVYRVAQSATEQKINITNLQTNVSENNGKTLYSLVLEIEIPDTATLLNFQKNLESLKKELQVDMTLKAGETKTL